MSLKKKGYALVAASASLALTASFAVITTPANAVSAACANIGAGYIPVKGGAVEIYTSVIQPELQKYINAAKDFTTCTGIKINFNGTNTFESTLPVRVKGGNAPDIALVPQPSLVTSMVQTGKAVPASAKTTANVNRYWAASWRGYGSVDGKLYATPNSANMKSLVWYSPKQFAKNNYTIPTTWDDMIELSDKMVANKQTAWCAGIGSGTATGWPATDWVEEVVVRQAGAKAYADWISHKIKFSDPIIQKAMKTVENLWGNSKYVGDSKAVATTTFQDAGLTIPKGGCMMLQQASFYGSQYPKGTDISPNGDVWAYYLPGINPSVKTPVEGGGEFFMAFNDKPATQQVRNYLSTPNWAESVISSYAASGSTWTTANTGVKSTSYKNPFDALVVKYLADPKSTFVFDASDLMPSSIGAGVMWKEFTNWFAQGKSTADIAKEIDNQWPSN